MPRSQSPEDFQKLLNPVEPQLVLNPGYIKEEETTIVVEERVWAITGADKNIYDTNGKFVVGVQAKSVFARKAIQDINGHTLFYLRNRPFSFKHRMFAEDESGNELFVVRRKISTKVQLELTFVNATTAMPATLQVDGDRLGTKAAIYNEAGETVAQISRELWDKQAFIGNKQTYYVQVAPGVDLSLMTALCIAFDEIKNDKRRHGGS